MGSVTDSHIGGKDRRVSFAQKCKGFEHRVKISLTKVGE